MAGGATSLAMIYNMNYQVYYMQYYMQCLKHLVKQDESWHKIVV